MKATAKIRFRKRYSEHLNSYVFSFLFAKLMFPRINSFHLSSASTSRQPATSLPPPPPPPPPVFFFFFFFYFSD
jgi:hypothetical protein